MSASILDEIVAELHIKHGEEAEHILPEHRVSTRSSCCSAETASQWVFAEWRRQAGGNKVCERGSSEPYAGQGCKESDSFSTSAGAPSGEQQEVPVRHCGQRHQWHRC